MTLEEIIRSLEDQAIDRDSSVDEDDLDCIFRHDAKALRAAAELLQMQKIQCAEAGQGTYRCYVTVPGYNISCDKCLATEIRMLNDAGIRTIGCCCGHGADVGYIQVDPQYFDEMKWLGYTERKLDSSGNGLWCFIPKSILPITVPKEETKP